MPAPPPILREEPLRVAVAVERPVAAGDGAAAEALPLDGLEGGPVERAQRAWNNVDRPASLSVVPASLSVEDVAGGRTPASAPSARALSVASGASRLSAGTSWARAVRDQQRAVLAGLAERVEEEDDVESVASSASAMARAATLPAESGLACAGGWEHVAASDSGVGTSVATSQLPPPDHPPPPPPRRMRPLEEEDEE